MSKSSMAARVTYARNLRGISQESLAELAGVSQSSIGDIESGKVKTSRSLGKIAKALKASFEWLAEGEGEEPSEHDSFSEPAPKNIPGYFRVKMLRSNVGAGNAAKNEDDAEAEIPGGLLFRQYSLSSRGLDPDSQFVVFVRGESMEPCFSHGDAVMIDTASTRIVNDEIYAFQPVQGDGECLIKRLFLTTDGRIRIVSDNSDKRRYPDEFVSPDQIRIIGTYAWQAKFNPRLLSNRA